MYSKLKLKHLLFGIIFAFSFSLPSFAADLAVSYIDIGQGDSQLIELPEGKNILIDAGDRDGADKLINYLKERKVKKLDTVIITHPHLDHFGGLLKTLKIFPVGQVLDSGAPTTASTYLKLLKELSTQKVKFKVSRKGDQINYAKGITLKILAPEEPLFEDTRSDTNNSSVVAKLTYNKISFLFTGDIESESQNKMIKENPADLKADFLKVAHHGSRYTTSQEFLDEVKPKFAFISVGVGNSYEHPHEETLKRLKESKIKIYRTDLDGTILVSTNGTDYNIQTKNSGIKIKNQTEKTDLNNASNEELEQEKPRVKVSKVNINTATAEELETLPGIGKKTVQNIIKGRPYKSIEDIGKIPGIGENRLDKIIELITIK